MQIAFLNPQGNFDPADSYLTEHPDFGGQLVYVKQVALALGELGHQVDILTRQINDPAWPEFAAAQDHYPNSPNLRILRLPAGPKEFLRKELLWPHLVRDWVPNIIKFYKNDGRNPDYFSAHYGDGGICGVLLENLLGIPFSFTAHSLGAQKMDKLNISSDNLQELEDYFFFRRRLAAERLSMNRSIVNITSTDQERQMQYRHNAYRGAVDWTNNNEFAVIPPGVDLEVFDKNSWTDDEDQVIEYLTNKLMRDLPVERQDFPCIVAASRLDPKKNHLGLVEAFASNPELRQKANLVIITGNLENPLNDFNTARIAEKSILDSILDMIDSRDLRGQVSIFAIQGQIHLGAAYRYFSRKRSIFALTALYEPFGLAPLEAMAAGMPAVVTKNGGPSESMCNGGQEFGILVDPTDQDQISKALYQLISNSDLWDKFAHAGYKRVQSHYVWKRTAEGYANILKHAQENHPRSAIQLPIHPYFIDPTPENDLTIDDLVKLYFIAEE